MRKRRYVSFPHYITIQCALIEKACMAIHTDIEMVGCYNIEEKILHKLTIATLFRHL